MKKINKLISVILVLSVCISLFCISGFAVENNDICIQLPKETFGDIYLGDDFFMYPNEASKEVTFVNAGKVSVFSYKEGKFNYSEEIASYCLSSYLINNKVYFLNMTEYAEEQHIIIYNLDSKQVEKTIDIKNNFFSVIGADDMGRIYLFSDSKNENGLCPYALLDENGNILCEDSTDFEIYSFIGADTSTGNFFFECFYPFDSWGYIQNTCAVSIGNVNDEEEIVFSFVILEILSQEFFYEHQRAAELFDNCLAVHSSFNRSFELFTLPDKAITENGDIDSDVFFAVSFTFDEYFDASKLVGAQMLNFSNKNTALFVNGDTLTEISYEDNRDIATKQLAHSALSIAMDNDTVFVVEIEENKYYLEVLLWKQSSFIELSANKTQLKPGETAFVEYTTENTAINEKVYFESTNPQVISVSENGEVFAWSKGTASITAYLSNGISDSVEFNVTADDLKPSFSEKPLSGEAYDNIGFQDYLVWSQPMTSFLCENNDDSLTRVFIAQDSVVVEKYNKDTAKLISSKNIPAELPLFGGFFSGKDHYFLAFGQVNIDENNDAEVLRVVKYDKAWNRLGACSVKGANTTVPFDAGCLRMDETLEKLYVYTSHEMYASDDGFNHQANMTYVIDKQEMTVLDEFYDVMNNSYGYVSHSFNQFIKTDDDKIYRLDHGDAFPRGIYLSSSGINDSIIEVDYCIPVAFEGEVGDNYTGASLGGFELSENNCIISFNNAINTSDYTSNRNVCIVVVNKAFTEKKEVMLTDFAQSDNMTVFTPQLVKVGNNQFLVLWEEFSTATGYIEYMDTKAVCIDDMGNIVTDAVSINARLSDCQPIFASDKLVYWYASNGNNDDVLYSLNPFRLVEEIIPGDIDNDKRVTAADARLALRASVQLEKLSGKKFKAADVDKDNKITAKDARIILRASVGLEKLN